ncbi:hypothetical protein X740_07890 [Mesorhizobium sp. LNHC221B00]|uniref:helix-turn-helix domain-containing protein n=1 Tax=Mesorhizobium sp. LNHC221B00 TaxID=1287233 RepID=UPI0003CEE9D3|nr:helix-turn-helix domain-containing protein [Mesorhizobium sp. LNHC221B00]ESY81887.1 hypothetical protein X740_07890 [Mesorhizobium sp. LNHC221B00]
MGQPKTINKLFALQSALVDCKLAPGTDAKVLGVLIEYQNPAQGYSWPSIETIAEVAGLKERATRQSIRRLEDAGYLQTQLGGGRNRTSRYRARLECFDEAPLKERIRLAAKRRHNNAGFSETETRHDGAETRHDHDTKPGTTVPPNTSYGNRLTNNPSAAAASNSSSTHQRDETPAFLRKAELALKAARQDGRHFSGDETVKAYRWLRGVAGGDDYTDGDQVKGWAHRLSEELLELMDEQTLLEAAA